MTSRRWLVLYSLMLATLGICLLVLTDWLPALRGPIWLEREWHWPYFLRPESRWWMPILAAVVMLGVCTWWLGRSISGRLRLALVLLALMAANLFLQSSLMYADRPCVAAELVDRTLAPQTSGYYRTAADITSVSDVLRNYPQAMTAFDSEHARTHPPGLVLGNWLMIRSFEKMPAAATILANAIRPLRCTDLWALESSDATLAGLAASSIASPLAAALTIPLAYFSGRQLADEKHSRMAAALAATVPALLLFAPLADQMLAFLSLLSLLLLLLALQQRSLALYFASGLVISLASYASLGNLTLLVIPAVVLGVRYWQAVDERKAVLLRAGALLLGAAVMWIGGWVLWGTPPWEIATTAMDQHYELVTSQREYGIWLGFNLLDLLLFGGTALLFGFAGATVIALRQVGRRRVSVEGSLSLALGLLLVLLLASGTTRGEVGRIWLFLMALMAIGAGLFLACWLPGRRAAVLMIALQLALAVSIGLAWRPVEAVIVRAERPAMEQPSAEMVPLAMTFEEGIALSGYSISDENITPGESVDLTLSWYGSGPTQRPYTVFVHLVDSDGELVAQSDSWPVQGQWPTTCWQKGESVVDTITMSLAPELTTGEYSLLVGLYDAGNGRRLVSSDGRDVVHLATLRVIDNG